MDSIYYARNASLAGQVDSKGGFQILIYGLLVKSLWSDIPLKWLIKAGKSHDDPDFYKNVTQVTFSNGANGTVTSTRGTTWQMRYFIGGAFAVPGLLFERWRSYV